jgi:hypothetical protein
MHIRLQNVILWVPQRKDTAYGSRLVPNNIAVSVALSTEISLFESRFSRLAGPSREPVFTTITITAQIKTAQSAPN